jgi:flavin reductase (DIM6/NTAB) family NADH-FMN oxidoreductase RutF
MTTELSPGLVALGRIPSGLFVITTQSAGQETGMLASWVQQCSFEPPMVSFALKEGRYLVGWLTPGTPIAINVIPEGDKALLKHFGKGFEPGEPAFTGLEVERAEEQAPALAAAVATIHAIVRAQHPAGDHVLVLAEVCGGRVRSTTRPATHVRNSGTHY